LRHTHALGHAPQREVWNGLAPLPDEVARWARREGVSHGPKSCHGFSQLTQLASHGIFRPMELREWRLARTPKRTLDELSDLSGIPVSSLSRIERGEQWPTSEQVLAIVKATDGAVTAEELAELHARVKATPAAQHEAVAE
jgi:transcriptional regulator with XRE-family HTH domain